MHRPSLAVGLALLLAWAAGPARAAYCLNYSPWLMQQMRKAGSYGSSGCVATRAQCEAERARNPGHYVGSCYPTGADAAGGNRSPATTPDQAGVAAQKKIQARQQAERDAEQRAAQQARQDLLGGLKGVEPASSGLVIKLPPPPPAGGQARQQLDCVTRASAASGREDAARLGPGAPVHSAQDDFESAEDCRALSPAVPPVPAPTPVAADGIPADRAQLAQFLQALLARMAAARQQINGLDQDVARLEAQVAREEQQVPKVDLKTSPAGESDALRKAREALAKARADRQKAAAEYEQLQQQEQAARQRQAAP